MNRNVLALFAAAATLALASPAQAHPHVWVTMKSQVVYDASGVATGIRHAWTFDDMFSAFATQGLDSKEKGKFTREELAPLAEVNVSSLKEYDFFTYAKIEGKKADLTDASDYWLDYTDAVLTLHFTLPFKAPVKAKAVDFEVYDPTYFVDFALAEKDPVSLSGAPPGCQLTVGKPQEMTAEVAKRLAEIPPDQQIPSNSYGSQFANRISVKCP
jgi:ABC-type uncharacterized transport system substrate-binding protein